MKKAVSLLLALLLWVACFPAFANQWGLSGPLVSFVSRNKIWDEYTSISLFSKKNTCLSAAVLHSRYHNVLMVARKIGKDKAQYFTSTTAVYQPKDQKEAPGITCTDEVLTLDFGHEVFLFEYREDQFPAGLYLSSAHLPNFSVKMDWENGLYQINDRFVWRADPIALKDFSLSLFPRTQEDVLWMNEIYARAADASGFWHDQEHYIRIRKKGIVPVYSAPDKNAFRAAKGKASVSLSDGAQLLASWDGWALVEYDVSARTHRIGFVEGKHVKQVAPIFLTDVPVTLQNTYLTDDPFVSQYRIKKSDELKNARILALAPPFYAYISAVTDNGQPINGFVPIDRGLVPDRKPVSSDVSSTVIGTWLFDGGGNVAPDLFTLKADGIGSSFSLKEDVLLKNEGQPLDAVTEEMIDSRTPFTWRIEDAQGTLYGKNVSCRLLFFYENGLVSCFNVSFESKSAGESSHMLLIYQGEGGGSWKKIAP